MSNFAALVGALMKRGSWAGPTLTPDTAELGTRVRFTGGALAGNEGTVISYRPGDRAVMVRLDSGHVKPKVPIERLQNVGKLSAPELEKLKFAIGQSVAVPSIQAYAYGTGQANYVPPPGVATHVAITNAPAPQGPPVAPARSAAEIPVPITPRKPKAKPMPKRKADWDF